MDKTAAQEIFEAAFLDELEKMGCDIEMMKQAGILGKAWAIAKSPVDKMIRKIIPAQKVIKKKGLQSFEALQAMKPDYGKIKSVSGKGGYGA